ncbi:hypothetical protein [Flavilitoribacter nigricans]|uniref:Glycosyltransferase family 1 protein n=1 Tax=Flavilitoribacter nigricans (strain ATCC 23147 / DSM 23189 / NBRC 102662 / NCIMB 1420 / SS-2) TaxID=1122177 RepID=A0A2D0MZF4_FLAN2|nr:hypothetical protein [Flavilitoribacter nigricans]PHN01496.1 hypothetical protein CRP01_36965 [Flavilitoribacter nigricans DSM 23189 = NBRC 102662]
MTRINILTPQIPIRRGFNDFYPILKWENSFKKKNIKFRFYSHHLNPKLLECDVFLLDYRYYQFLAKSRYKIPGNHKYDSEFFILEVIESAKQKGCRVVLFDTGDSGGSSTSHITPFVDIHLKKQIFKDLSYYTERKSYNLMVWLPPGLKETRKLEFTPLKEKDVEKLRLGWNIGLLDYRWFPFKSFLPIGNSMILPGYYQKVRMRNPNSHKKYLLSYRGNSNKHESYDYQRNLASERLKNMRRDDILVGGKVSFSQYMKEQRDSKITLSPFGWGEICYRDFESVVNGSLLLKPKMDHLNTYPDFFKNGETYVSTNWDFSDLKEKLVEVSSNYERYISIIKNFQALFSHHQNSSRAFLEHFEKSVLS